MNGEVRKAYQDFAEEKLGFEFHDIMLLITALTHRSYVNEHKRAHIDHNERLEFLGDAVLELVTSDFLCRNFSYPEGVMTAIRSALVRTESIGDAGKKLGYAPLIRLSHGEKKGTERAHESIIADCFEAIIGAIYLDQGYDTAQKFIAKHILTKMDDVIKEGSWRDPKSLFQEVAQHYEGTTPYYRTIDESGPDHDKVFTVSVCIGSKELGTGKGHSKQDAQSIAARQAIERYRKEHDDFDKVMLSTLNKMK